MPKTRTARRPRYVDDPQAASRASSPGRAAAAATFAKRRAAAAIAELESQGWTVTLTRSRPS